MENLKAYLATATISFVIVKVAQHHKMKEKISHVIAQANEITMEAAQE